MFSMTKTIIMAQENMLKTYFHFIEVYIKTAKYYKYVEQTVESPDHLQLASVASYAGSQLVNYLQSAEH